MTAALNESSVLRLSKVGIRPLRSQEGLPQEGMVVAETRGMNGNTPGGSKDGEGE